MAERTSSERLTDAVTDDRVVVAFPFSRLDLEQQPQMYIPAAVRVKTPRIPRTGKVRAAMMESPREQG